MILSDQQLHERLQTGSLIIDPITDAAQQIQPCSVDLRLGTRFRPFFRTQVSVLDPLDPTTFTDHTYQVEIAQGSAFILHPGDFVLATTSEYVVLPSDLVGRTEGRSSVGRLGVLIHSTAGFIDPGFAGQITLEMTNVGALPVALYPGMRICQIVLEELSSPAAHLYGAARGSKYQNQPSPAPSSIYRDKEFRYLRRRAAEREYEQKRALEEHDERQAERARAGKGQSHPDDAMHQGPAPES